MTSEPSPATTLNQAPLTKAPIWLVHIFVCTNEREPEAKRVSCGRQCDTMAHVNYLKEELKQRGLQLDVRAQKAGCMEVCEQGPTVALYPQGWFFRVMDTAACAVVADVAEGLVRGTIRAPGDLNPVAQSLRIDPAAVAHVQARAARSTPPV